MCLRNVNKIAIIGGPGTGKTTLSKQLGDLLFLPTYSLDSIKFHKNWKAKSKEDVDIAISNLIQKPKWIIEGNHLRNLKSILQESELVVFLDFPMILQLYGIFRRFFSNFHYCIKNIKNCKERISFSFFLKTIFFNIRKRPKIISLLMRDYKFKLILIANYEQIEEFLKKIKNQEN